MTLSGSVRIHGESGTAEQRPAFSVFLRRNTLGVITLSAHESLQPYESSDMCTGSASEQKQKIVKTFDILTCLDWITERICAILK